jgi:hypothetical protein
LSVAVGSDGFGSDMPFQRAPESGQVEVAVHAAELAARFDHVLPRQRSAICPSRQRLTFLAWLRQIEIIDSTALVLRRVRARVDEKPYQLLGHARGRRSRGVLLARGV